MTNPNDPWGQRQADAPTEHLGPAVDSGRGDPARPTGYPEYSEGSGANPSEYPPAYAPTEQYGVWAPPGANATRELPPYEAQWGSYPDSTYQDKGGGQWANTAALPGNAPQPPAPPPPRRNTGLWIVLGLAVVLLVGAVGVAAGVMLGGDRSGSTSTMATSSAPATVESIPRDRTDQPIPPSGLPEVPGFGGIDGLGAVVGTITVNDNGTLSVRTVLGDTVTVRTDANTRVISLSSETVADLPTGELVMIEGDKASDGSLRARVIIGTSLPGGG
ncbi:DUF5666 domain-containing protein [Nocardia sp. 004]|uniref:DUF5666 domain-containing protein n=1 Tax=Nocardia sp. 004 TaxID=3385978 RepID=UPI0039A16D17